MSNRSWAASEWLLVLFHRGGPMDDTDVLRGAKMGRWKKLATWLMVDSPVS